MIAEKVNFKKTTPYCCTYKIKVFSPYLPISDQGVLICWQFILFFGVIRVFTFVVPSFKYSQMFQEWCSYNKESRIKKIKHGQKSFYLQGANITHLICHLPFLYNTKWKKVSSHSSYFNQSDITYQRLKE